MSSKCGADLKASTTLSAVTAPRSNFNSVACALEGAPDMTRHHGLSEGLDMESQGAKV